jgi:hypothetical protein
VIVARLLLVAVTMGALVSAGCDKKDEPSSKGAPATTASGPAPGAGSVGDIPTAEDFCNHIDKLSMSQMEGMPGTPEEKQQMIAEGHASCVAASNEDRKTYPEWGPCARCAMGATDLGTMEQQCDSLCKALGEKLDKKAAAKASSSTAAPIAP